MTTEHTPWEVGLGFTVSRNKGAFRGKDAVFAAEQSPRILPAGLVIDHSDSLAGGEVLKLNGEAVGVVNSPCWSHRMNQSLALGHVSPAAASPGTALVAVAEDSSDRQTVWQHWGNGLPVSGRWFIRIVQFRPVGN